MARAGQGEVPPGTPAVVAKRELALVALEPAEIAYDPHAVLVQIRDASLGCN